MKRIFTFFFALLSACTFSAYAAIIDGTCGDNLTWTLNTEDSTLVISGTGEMKTSFLSVPWSDYRSYIKYITLPDGLTSIGSYAFCGCSGLTSITIPNSVTSIGVYAFGDCSGLTSPVYNAHCFAYMPSSYEGHYIIPDGIKQIAGGAFSSCYSLTDITIPNSVTSIGSNAFYGCKALTSVTIPNSVTSIGYEAFRSCSSLTSITIPNSVTSIGDWTFYSCYGLKSVTIPNSVTSIGYEAFSGCSGLTSITIPNNVTSIGYGAFSSCDGLTSIIVEQGNAKYDCRENSNAIIETATNTLISGCQNTIIPNSVTNIGDVAFEGCSALTSITIPNSVTSIGGYAFKYCSSLTSITIPNSVTSIGTEVFSGCESLTSVTLGNSVTSIEKGAFINSNIQEVTAYMPTPPAAAGCGLNHTSCTLYVPAEYIDTYSNTFWWEDFKEIRAIAQNEEGADKEFEVVFSDQDNNELSAQSVTLRVPVAPQIEGFTFLYWQPVAAPLDDMITIQAVYESDSPTEAPEVFVNPSNPAQKLIRNGQVYILHEDKMYTISGQVVK